MPTGKNNGFTLIEVIVAIVIAVSLGAAVYATLAQGVRIWTRTSKDRGEWKVDLFVAKLTGELKNTFRDPQGMFKGNHSELFFPSMASWTDDKNESGVTRQPVYLRYVFDSGLKSLSFEKKSFTDLMMKKGRPPTIALEDVKLVEWEYYSYDDKAKSYRWFTEWNKDCFPETLKITIETKSSDHHKWVRMIDLPLGNACSV